MAAPPLAVRIRDLSVRHGSVVALERFSLDIPAGDSVAVIGANGSGKSTLLRTVAGLQSPTEGSIAVDGEVAIVLQTTTVNETLPLTAREAVRMARYARRGPFRRLRPDDHDAVERAMDRLGVADLAQRQLGDLSGGQRQRVLVAQGLAQEADVVLLDEPVAGLDLASKGRILDVVEDEHAQGRTVLMSTHDLDEARTFRHVILLATELVAAGSPDEVLVEANLRKAFQGRVHRLPDGELLLDDVHLGREGSCEP